MIFIIGPFPFPYMLTFSFLNISLSLLHSTIPLNFLRMATEGIWLKCCVLILESLISHFSPFSMLSSNIHIHAAHTNSSPTHALPCNHPSLPYFHLHIYTHQENHKSLTFTLPSSTSLGRTTFVATWNQTILTLLSSLWVFKSCKIEQPKCHKWRSFQLLQLRSFCVFLLCY